MNSKDGASFDSPFESKLHAGSAEMRDLRYGYCSYRPRWLQRMNGIRGCVAWFCVAYCFSSMLGGFIGVVTSTLEKRFHFSSSQSSLISGACEVGILPVVLAVGFFGDRIHRPFVCAMGLLVSATGCLFFVVPQFSIPFDDPWRKDDSKNPTTLCLTNATPASSCSTATAEGLSSYLPIFIVGSALMGVGLTTIAALGVTFMHDCSTRRKFGIYAGILSAMSIVGPAMAYLGGGYMLSINVDFWTVTENETGLTSKDSRWIGAWWLPFAIAAVLCTLSTIPILGYPRDLPGAAEIRKARTSEAHDGKIDDSNSVARMARIESCGEFKQVFRGVCTNPTYVCLTLFVCSVSVVVAGFTAFGPKSLEVNFSLTAAMSAAIYGVVILPAGAGGTIVGGILIQNLNLTCRQIILAQTVLCAFFACSMSALFLTCNPLLFAGVNMAYDTNATSMSGWHSLVDSCNVECECRNVAYNPVCSHDNVMYYSPCHAGCRSMSDDGETKHFYNCSCIVDPAEGGSAEATSRPCSGNLCPGSVLFLFVFFFAVVAMFMCISLNISATLRCVNRNQAAFAFGVQNLLIRFPGTILGPIFFGMAFDRACIQWQRDPCGEVENCIAYDNRPLSLYLFLTCLTASLVSLAALVLALLLYRPPVLDEGSNNAEPNSA